MTHNEYLDRPALLSRLADLQGDLEVRKARIATLEELLAKANARSLAIKCCVCKTHITESVSVQCEACKARIPSDLRKAVQEIMNRLEWQDLDGGIEAAINLAVKIKVIQIERGAIEQKHAR